jgi:hypothetical protein
MRGYELITQPVGTPFILDVNKVTINTSVNSGHDLILADATSNNLIVSLPTASGISGRVYYFKKIDNTVNTVTIDGNGAETIDGVANYILSLQYEFVQIVSDGSNWFVLGE